MFLHAIIITIYCILETDTVAYTLFEITTAACSNHSANPVQSQSVPEETCIQINSPNLTLKNIYD